MGSVNLFIYLKKKQFLKWNILECNFQGKKSTCILSYFMLFIIIIIIIIYLKNKTLIYIYIYIYIYS